MRMFVSKIAVTTGEKIRKNTGSTFKGLFCNCKIVDDNAVDVTTSTITSVTYFHFTAH